MKYSFIKHQLILIILSIFLFQNKIKAQIEPILVGATTRNMLVYAPDNIEKNRPLLISMHGLNQDITYQQNQTQWETIADESNFVVVYPAGINNSWDLGGTSDTDFILAIIDEMFSRYGIDRDRVYLSGFSMGGMMTYHAMNVIADKIAAFAPVSGYLMGGPNTNSSRPVPIIHTHGTSDPVVGYSGVQTCLDAWIARNGCPDVAEVTKPYPADKPNSNGTKYYWGPGTDNVEVVLLSLAGVGHWHSIDGNGVHTSREIWDFCKKYSLGFGVPKFHSAAVTENNPKQINLTLSESIIDSSLFSGFTIKIDGLQVTIDSVVLADTNILAINLSDSVLKENEITLSYVDGNVYSTLKKKLVTISDTIVDNFLEGSSPRLINISTTEYGDTLVAKFNKKMLLPGNISDLELTADFNGDINIPILETSIDDDSTKLLFALTDTVYADYTLSLSYLGNNIVSSDSGLLKTFSEIPVINNSVGLPVQLDTAKLGDDASSITLEFSKPMTITNAQKGQISLVVNGESVSYKDFYLLKNAMTFILSDNLHYDDTLIVSYSPGDITAADKGPLETFTDYEVINPIDIPTWHQVPGKIEAENYALQSGTDTEKTSDTGGGLNVGWIENGDWMEYALENNTTDTKFEITFRVASTSADGRMACYLDNKRISIVSVPNTNSWQSWTSVVKSITLTPGKHYLKLVANTGGYNVNYMEIKLPEETGIGTSLNDEINIYPNPVSNEMVINSGNFQYNNVEIIDVMGKIMLSETANFETSSRIPVCLTNGIYFVKIGNTKEYQLKKIIVTEK